MDDRGKQLYPFIKLKENAAFQIYCVAHHTHG